MAVDRCVFGGLAAAERLERRAVTRPPALTRSAWRIEPRTSEVASVETPAAIAAASSARRRARFGPQAAQRPRPGRQGAPPRAQIRLVRDEDPRNVARVSRAPARRRRRVPRPRRTRRRWHPRAALPRAPGRLPGLRRRHPFSRSPPCRPASRARRPVDRRLERVAGRARDLRHDRALGADERVEERRLSGVGPAEDRDAAAVGEQSSRPGRRGERGELGPARSRPSRAAGGMASPTSSEKSIAPVSATARRAVLPHGLDPAREPAGQAPRRGAPRRESGPRSGRGRPRPARGRACPRETRAR